jgi:hypothetical protein
VRVTVRDLATRVRQESRNALHRSSFHRVPLPRATNGLFERETQRRAQRRIERAEQRLVRGDVEEAQRRVGESANIVRHGPFENAFETEHRVRAANGARLVAAAMWNCFGG